MNARAVNISIQYIAETLTAAGVTGLPPDAYERFQSFVELLSRWSAKINLTASRTPEEIVRLHIVECAFAAQRLPSDTQSLLDYGSGAGFPGLPIAICHPGFGVTLAEAHGRKAAFLREAVRLLALPVEVFEGRVDGLNESQLFDAVTLRAVERMESAIPVALAHARRSLVLFTTEKNVLRDQRSAKGRSVTWQDAITLPATEQRILMIGKLN